MKKKVNRIEFLIMRQLLSNTYLKVMALGREDGQDLIEYALVVALIAFAATVGMGSVAASINAAFVNVGTKLSAYVT
jgi:pilus assembly protein Flp/PilA